MNHCKKVEDKISLVQRLTTRHNPYFVTCVMNTCLLERLNVPMLFHYVCGDIDRLTLHEFLQRTIENLCGVARCWSSKIAKYMADLSSTL